MITEVTKDVSNFSSNHLTTLILDRFTPDPSTHQHIIFQRSLLNTNYIGTAAPYLVIVLRHSRAHAEARMNQIF